MKLLSNNINGKIFRLIYNMYHSIKSCVSYNGERSAYFQSFRGVRQGENISPVLFALLLNDLESFLLANNCNGINMNFRYDQNRYISKGVCLTLRRRYCHFWY